jgi:hypothetical protein
MSLVSISLSDILLIIIVIELLSIIWRLDRGTRRQTTQGETMRTASATAPRL